MKKKYKSPKIDNIEFEDVILASGTAWQDNGQIVDPDPGDHWGTVFF